MIFCGEAIGEAAPPMLEASAIPRISAFEKLESPGKFRSKGCPKLSTILQEAEIVDCTCIIEKQRTGAATLLINILAIRATNILMIKTVLGRVPALLRTNVAIILAIEYLDRAAAIVKPPNRSMMTGVHIAANMYLVALLGFSL